VAIAARGTGPRGWGARAAPPPPSARGGPPHRGEGGGGGRATEADPPILHTAKPHLLHEGGQSGRRDESVHRLWQVGVRLAVPTHDGADPRDDVMGIGAEEGGPAWEIRLRDLEGDNATARTREAAQLTETLAEIAEVPEEEGRGDEGESARLEGQGEGIRFHEADASRRLLRAALESRDGEHAVGEVCAHHRAVPVDLAQLEREVAGARGEVETGAVRRGNGLAGRRSSPRGVHPERHEPVHEVVAPGDAREHLVHVAGLARSLSELHAHRTRPARTATKRMTEM